MSWGGGALNWIGQIAQTANDRVVVSPVSAGRVAALDGLRSLVRELYPIQVFPAHLGATQFLVYSILAHIYISSYAYCPFQNIVHRKIPQTNRLPNQPPRISAAKLN